MNHGVQFTCSDLSKKIKYCWEDKDDLLINCTVTIQLVYVPEKEKLGLYVRRCKGDANLFYSHKRQLEEDFFMNIEECSYE